MDIRFVKHVLILLLGLYGFAGLGQVSTPVNTIPDTSDVKRYNKIATQYLSDNPDSSIYYFNLGLQIAEQRDLNNEIVNSLILLGDTHRSMGNHSLAIKHFLDAIPVAIKTKDNETIYKVYRAVGVSYHYVSQYDKAIEYLKKSLEHSYSTDLKKGTAVSLYSLGNTYTHKGDYEEALDYYHKSLSVSQELNDSTVYSDNLIAIGNVFRFQGNLSLALDQLLAALGIKEKIEDWSGVALAYNSIGNIYNTQRNYSKALENYNKSLEIRRQIEDRKGESANLNNIGMIVAEQGFSLISSSFEEAYSAFKQAIDYHTESLAIKEDLNYLRGKSASYNNLGRVYYYIGNLFRLNNDFNRAKTEYQRAIEYYLKSLRIDEKIGHKNGQANVNVNISDLYLELASVTSASESKRNLNYAVDFGQRAYTVALEVGALPTQNNAANCLKKAFSKLGYYKDAFRYSEIFHSTRDSLFNKEKLNAIADLQHTYELQKKQHEIENQKLLIDKQRIDNKQQRIQRNIIAIISLLILLVSLGTLLGYQVIRKKNKLLAQSELELKSLVQTKDRLFSIVAHDLKSPFTALMGLTEIMSRDAHKMDQAEIAEYSQLVHESSQNIFVLIENLLHWSRRQTGSIQLNPKILKLADLIREEVSVLEMQANSKGVSIKNEISEDIKISADHDTFSTVIRNLISNAIKYTQSGGLVTISLQVLNGNVYVNISDTGMGIAPENLEKLFKIGENISTKGTNMESGTGLGLIVCKEFVEMNGGKILVKSTIDQGSTFTVTLPVA